MMLLIYGFVRDQAIILKSCGYRVKNDNVEHGKTFKFPSGHTKTYRLNQIFLS